MMKQQNVMKSQRQEKTAQNIILSEKMQDKKL